MSSLDFGRSAELGLLFGFNCPEYPVNQRDILVIALHNPLPSADQLSTLIVDYFESAPSPSQIWLLGLASDVENLNALCSARLVADRVPTVTRYVESPDLSAAIMDESGSLTIHRPGGTTKVLKETTRNQLFAQGMAVIFRQRNGILRSGPGFHYIKPSGRHSTAFLRAANALTSNVEIWFVALAVYARLSGVAVRRIYTDSSSINSVALALVAIGQRLSSTFDAPDIWSFGSYHGLDAGYEISSDAQSVILISASTSGDLERKLTSMFSVDRSRIYTLFFVGESASPGVVCDLTSRKDSVVGYIDPFDSWDGECPLCARHQSTVVLSGDQFLPANPIVTPHMLVKADAPRWLSSFMQSVYGTGCFQTHASDGTRERRVRSVVLRLGSAIDAFSAGSAIGIAAAVSRSILKTLPAATDWIVYLDDPDSRAFAMAVARFLQDRGLRFPDDHLVSSTDLLNQELQLPGVVLVVGSAVATGRSIMSVSRALRTASPMGIYSYFIMVPRMARPDQWAELQSNLSYGEHHPREHNVAAVEVIYLPYDDGPSVWEREVDAWNLVIEFLDSAEISDDEQNELITAVLERIDVLEAAPGNGGLANSTFLPAFDRNGAHDLSLRPNFAFWDWDYVRHPSRSSPTQPEVFATMMMVLHNLRGQHRDFAGPFVNDHNWRVLAPRVFSRFNDGVIQAAILRAVVGQECDYSVDVSLSKQMVDVIGDTLHRWDREDGEAAAEMLLAVAMERVQLSESHYKLVRNSIDCEGMPALLRALAYYVRDAMCEARETSETRS